MENITPIDVEYLITIAEHGKLRSSDLYRLFHTRNPKKIRLRLKRLRELGLVRRVKSEQRFQRWGGREFNAVELCDKSRRLLLREQTTLPPHYVSRLFNESVDPYVNHALLVNELQVRLEADASGHPEIEFLNHWRVRDEVFIKDQPFRLWVNIVIKNIGFLMDIEPDRLSAIRFRELPEGRNMIVLFNESYRKRSVSKTRSDLEHKSVEKSLIAYQELKNQGMHRQFFPCPFRVLTITDLTQRVSPLLELNYRLNGGFGNELFLYQSAQAIRSADDVYPLSVNCGSKFKCLPLLEALKIGARRQR